MKAFGFGLMRLPMKGENVDIEETKKMTDLFLEEGFTYFDTAHGYIKKKSEPAAREALVDRYPRDRYTLTDKLSSFLIEKEEDIFPFFEKQLEITQAQYFDYYLHHSLSEESYATHVQWKAFEKVKELKDQGKIKHIGISFHDKADVLEKILQEQEHIEFVQLQINYLDWNDKKVQAAKCYEVCEKFNKPVIVMEPVKGGSLANLPKEAKQIFDGLGKKASYASYALRFVAELPNVFMILSGMSSLEQMQDNLETMKDPRPLDARERQAIEEVTKILSHEDMIPCTACEYCLEGCPSKIEIPSILAILNKKQVFQEKNQEEAYKEFVNSSSPASSCIDCKQCEGVCPQEIKISEHMKRAAELFE